MIAPVMPTYARADLAFVRGEGCRLFDAQGRAYLDFAAGMGVNALGHAHPHLVSALKKQADALWHCSNLYRVPGQEEVAARLIDLTFAETVFFTNSGAEAVETALKTARKYHHQTGHPERYRVITCLNSFHGRTLATIAAGGREKLTHGFGPAMDGFDHVPFANMNALRAAVTEETAAVMVEPVQGEGGVNFAGIDYLQGLRETCDEFGLLLILDEVQCGMGRSGRMFAHEWANIAPDIMAIAKGIGGGFPVGACLATEKAACGMTAGTHGSTYGGNPLAMAVASAVLDVMAAPDFLDRVVTMGEHLEKALLSLQKTHGDKISELRGMGLMRGLKCAENIDTRRMIEGLRKRGLLCAPAGDNVIRLLPPLIVDEQDIESAKILLDQAFHEEVS